MILFFIGLLILKYFWIYCDPNQDKGLSEN